MQPVTSTHPSSASSPHDLHDDVMCTIHVTALPALRLDWETLAWLTSKRSKPLDLDTCPTLSSSSHWYCGATHKTIAHFVLRPKPRNHRANFMGQITKPQLPVLRPKQGKPSEWFWGQTTKTVATGFEAKLGETVNLGLEAKPRNSHFSSPRAQCRPYTTSPDLSIVRPPSTQHVLHHPQSSAPSLLHLSPTHHETSKCISPHETDSRVEPPKFPEFKFKPR
jgi:hypothetical protein